MIAGQNFNHFSSRELQLSAREHTGKGSYVVIIALTPGELIMEKRLRPALEVEAAERDDKEDSTNDPEHNRAVPAMGTRRREVKNQGAQREQDFADLLRVEHVDPNGVLELTRVVVGGVLKVHTENPRQERQRKEDRCHK